MGRCKQRRGGFFLHLEEVKRWVVKGAFGFTVDMLLSLMDSHVCELARDRKPDSLFSRIPLIADPGTLKLPLGKKGLWSWLLHLGAVLGGEA
jgi:hypothetical protein